MGARRTTENQRGSAHLSHRLGHSYIPQPASLVGISSLPFFSRGKGSAWTKGQSAEKARELDTEKWGQHRGLGEQPDKAGSRRYGGVG